ncbi:GtrA family protein [Thiocapsa roseopersicina]|uniref:Putative flippase GtrA (Transmembrane translocase of bactoprenol-linked glucose) n=1 Tax=Thiocapsa roseopersicina TaxID=1058 RepID=A0A1H2QD45_THIRO|nr:Putative flippase GtrA (transmembrane translocase of bactoprenol-linked glucose) [Thiocapsa roseopersicina]
MIRGAWARVQPEVPRLVRYGLVGIFSNLLGYGIYLGIVWLGVDPKVTVSLLYPIGALIAYFGHASVSFSYTGNHSSALARYIGAHAIGYGTNIALLYVFFDRLGFPHQLVQAVAIFVVAGVLFFLLRYVVFPTTGTQVHARVR